MKPLNSNKNPQIKLRLTKAGVGWLIACLCCFLLATNYNNNVIFMLACLLFAVALLSAGLTYKNMLGIEGVQWRVKPSFAGGKASYQLHLVEQADTDHFELKCQEQVVAHLQKQQNGYLDIEIETQNRGYFQATELFLHSCWPLGLWTVSLVLPTLPRCLVYPALLGEQALPIEDQFSLDQLALDEVSGLDEYQVGDNTRRIDWKASARSEQLLIKTVAGDETQQTLWLSDDAVNHSDQELILSQLAVWVVECQQAGLHYGVKVGDEKCQPSSGEAHRLTSLTMLALC
ncbi:MAG: DUF58 domain-containing protein [Psychromonas sp.]|nr:DUF58 domain-containing protein [Psychromonas sp.]